MRFALILLALVLLPACSQRAWYEGVQQSRIAECERLPPGAANDCLRRVNTLSHEQYERERAKAAAQP